MNLRLVLSMMLLLVLTHTAIATEKAPFVSKTFQEIQSRVTSRDADTGAILAVKAKEDAPTFFSDLNFSITEATSGDHIVIVLSRNWKTGEEVYEKYLLRPDEALRHELQNQKRLESLLAERESEYREKQKQKITTLTAGQLRFGMPVAEVERIRGKAGRAVSNSSELGTFTWIYPDLRLHFVRGLLHDVEQTQNEQE